MYKSKLQELCQRRSWNLPEYTIAKDGPDHIPRFKAVAIVNGMNFETPEGCRSSKDAQNTAAKIAFDYFNVHTPTRVQHQAPPSAGSAVLPPLVCAVSPSVAPTPGIQAVVPVGQVTVPVAPLPASLPLPSPGILAPDRSAHVEPIRNEMMQQNVVERAQTSMVYRTPIVSNSLSGVVTPNNDTIMERVSKDMTQPSFEDMTQTSMIYKTPFSNDILPMYKNRLQQYAQRKNLSLPIYICQSDGPPHARRFKSRVSFDGKSYETVEFFPTLKEAEYAAAKVACQMLLIDQSHEDCSLFKSLLQELAQKRGLLCPTYTTVRSGPVHSPIFVSIVEVGSVVFRGDEAKSKKQAEMSAATVAYSALTRNSLKIETPNASSMGKCPVADNSSQNGLTTETTKRDVFIANEETEISVERVESFPENETANSLALPLSEAAPEVSSAVKNPAVAEPINARQTLSSRTVVSPRTSNFPIPEGAVVACSNDEWIAYKVMLNQEPSA